MAPSGSDQVDEHTVRPKERRGASSNGDRFIFYSQRLLLAKRCL